MNIWYSPEWSPISVLTWLDVDTTTDITSRQTTSSDCTMWAWGNPPSLPIHFPISPSSALLLFLFTFSLSCSLHLFSYLSIPCLSTRIGPLRFQAGGHRRRLNLGLVFCVMCIF